jgi:hypothetical protein
MTGSVRLDRLLEQKAFSDEVLNEFGISRREPVKVRIIRMSDKLMDTLDYVSKLSREPSHIARLIQEGERQGRAFLDSLASEPTERPPHEAGKRMRSVTAA